MAFLNRAGGPHGFTPDNYDVNVYNRTGGTIVEGMIVMFDTTASDAAITATPDNAIFGDAGTIWSNVIVPSATAGAPNQLVFGLFGVALEGAADNAKFRCRVQGTGKLRVAAVTAGAGVRVVVNPDSTNGSAVTGVAQSTTKPFGHTLEAATLASAGTVQSVWDGIYGLGQAIP